jgi:hypothetical protein
MITKQCIMCSVNEQTKCKAFYVKIALNGLFNEQNKHLTQKE